MARAQIRITDREWRRIVALPSVRAALRQRAQAIAGRARGIAATETPGASITTEEGTRPRGRTYARVASDDPEGEYGTQTRERRRVLGRAANTKE
ncbi:hypothetical protein [Saccharopolyspora rosea]|uniref:hypothetical protein n=1 Tax=Saccharopolyspora rosea TaxID=524884 RepID=UPI0021D81FB5|nr:hypothetical protein [Saccharopolyspora rosea]